MILRDNGVGRGAGGEARVRCARAVRGVRGGLRRLSQGQVAEGQTAAHGQGLTPATEVPHHHAIDPLHS